MTCMNIFLKAMTVSFCLLITTSSNILLLIYYEIETILMQINFLRILDQLKIVLIVTYVDTCIDIFIILFSYFSFKVLLLILKSRLHKDERIYCIYIKVLIPTANHTSETP